eukprot:3936142-Rhodomonas_salina.1
MRYEVVSIYAIRSGIARCDVEWYHPVRHKMFLPTRYRVLSPYEQGTRCPARNEGIVYCVCGTERGYGATRQ